MLLTSKNPETHALRSSSTKDKTENRRQADLLQRLSKLEIDLQGSDSDSQTLGQIGQMLPARRVSINLDNQQLKDPRRNLADILLFIGKAMVASNFPCDAPGRGKQEILGQTAFRSRLYAEFKIDLPTEDIELLTIHFDSQKKGEINLNVVLGSAQLNYDKWRKGGRDSKIIKKLDIVRNHKIEQKHAHLSKRTEGTQRSAEMIANILNILKEHSFNLLTTKDTRLTAQSRRLVMNSSLFQALLGDLGINLSSKERKLLEERYVHTKAGTIDFLKFKSEFLTLGAELLLQKKRLMNAMSLNGKENVEDGITPIDTASNIDSEVREDGKDGESILSLSLKSALKNALPSSLTPSLDNSYDGEESVEDSQNLSSSLNSSTALSIIPNFSKMSGPPITSQSQPSIMSKLALVSSEMQILAANQPNYMNKLVLTNNNIEDIFAAVASMNSSVSNTPKKSAMKIKGSKLKPLTTSLTGTGHFRKNRKASTILEDDADGAGTGSGGNTNVDSGINTAGSGRRDGDDENGKNSNGSRNIGLDSDASNFNSFSPLTTRGKTGELHCFTEIGVMLDGIGRKGSGEGNKNDGRRKGDLKEGDTSDNENDVGKGKDKENSVSADEKQKMVRTIQDDDVSQLPEMYELSIESHKPFGMGKAKTDSEVINAGEWLPSPSHFIGHTDGASHHVNGDSSQDTGLSEVSSKCGYMGDLIIDNDTDYDNKGDDNSNISSRRGGGGGGGAGGKSVVSAAGTEITEQILLKHYSGSQMNFMKGDDEYSRNALKCAFDDLGSMASNPSDDIQGQRAKNNKVKDEEIAKRKRDEEEDEREVERYLKEEEEEERRRKDVENDIMMAENTSRGVNSRISKTGFVDVEVGTGVVTEDEVEDEYKIFNPSEDSCLSSSLDLRRYRESLEVEIEDKVGVNSVNQ